VGQGEQERILALCAFRRIENHCRKILFEIGSQKWFVQELNPCLAHQVWIDSFLAISAAYDNRERRIDVAKGESSGPLIKRFRYLT
jgi:hypothetical protein